MDKLHIILRAYEGEKRKGNTRPMGMSKPEVMRACVRSLHYSVADVREEVRISVIADRLSDESTSFIQEQLAPNRLLDGGYGNDDSLRLAFDLAADTYEDDQAGMVYMVEDDYLHTEWAVREIVCALDMIQKQFNWIHPTDYPDFYTRDAGYQAQITTGSRVHWRQCRTTTFTFAGHAEKFAELRDEMISTCLNARDGDLSEILWDNGGLACPIPTLAAHWQNEHTLPPFPPIPPQFRDGDVLRGWGRFMAQFQR